MVRVISVHHFLSQDIHVCDDPVAVTTAPGNRLLVALAHHIVQVRDLANGGEVTFTFPTVDKVEQILHCAKGNYVATLETKQNRQGKVSTYARIYANWDVPSVGRESTGVRARIAGRVTPTSQQSTLQGLEMIELPVKRTPVTMACCQANGSIIISSNKSVALYFFRVRTHDISRQKFIDFEESGLTLELSFAPTRLELCENVIACMNSQHVHVFKIGTNILGGQSEVVNERPTKDVTVPKSISRDYIDWDAVLQCKKSSDLSRKLDPNSYPLVVDLPTIASERAAIATLTRRQSPFKIATKDMFVNVKCSSPSSLWTESAKVMHLLQLQLSETESSSKQGSDEFRCLLMKPFYVKLPETQRNKTESNLATHPLRSPDYDSLGSIVCVVATQQEGYLYHLPMAACTSPAAILSHCDYDLKMQQSACITVYPFTAPVSMLALEHCALHALTETGLETYTVRCGHHLVQDLENVDNVSNACPSAEDPVCLIGLRPFLGVEHLLVSESHLILLACSEGSSISSQDSHGTSWTLYSLLLPDAILLYGDLVSMGSSHRWSSPTTYCHLLSEGHIMLRTLRLLADRNITEHEEEVMEQLYKESCALLGDFYICGFDEESWRMATPYYKQSGLTPIQVVDRVCNIKIYTDDQQDTGQTNNNIAGLIYYLKTCLLLMNKAEDDLLFTPAVPNFVNVLLDLFESSAANQVSSLVLSSKLLREYATDRVLEIMKRRLRTGPHPEPTDALALAMLCIQKNFPAQAVSVLNSLQSDTLTSILTVNHELVLETTKDKRRFLQSLAFTELATVLFDTQPKVLAQVLFNLINTEVLKIQQVLQVFLEYFPRTGLAGSGASFVLQNCLELYFACYFKRNSRDEFELSTMEALKILVRSYLGDLQRRQYDTPQSQPTPHLDDRSPLELVMKKSATESSLSKKWILKDDSEKVLFEDCRPTFLSKMPPHAASLTAMLVSPGQEITTQEVQNTTRSDVSLLKLEALLSSCKLPSECFVEARQFVETHPRLHGSLTLQVLSLPLKDAASLVLNFCPQALLQFCQDKFSSNDEWKWIISQLQRKIKMLVEDNFLKIYYNQVMADILTYLSQTIPLESLVQVLPPGGDASYESYIHICQQTSHANHIGTLLMATELILKLPSPVVINKSESQSNIKRRQQLQLPTWKNLALKQIGLSEKYSILIQTYPTSTPHQ